LKLSGLWLTADNEHTSTLLWMDLSSELFVSNWHISSALPVRILKFVVLWFSYLEKPEEFMLFESFCLKETMQYYDTIMMNNV
jgi:hypothetical protein